MNQNNQQSLIADREKHVRFAQGHVATVTKYYGLLCESLGSVIRKSARLRNKSDTFAHLLKDYAETENFSSYTKSSLISFAENLSTVQDYRHTEVQRLEAKVLKPLIKYGDLCKNMKSSIKEYQNAWSKEKSLSEKLRKLELKVPAHNSQIVKTQEELQRMQHLAADREEKFVTTVDEFEKNKVADMKSVLCEFVQIEMIFHARALEYLSKCYDAASRIQTQLDMDHLQATLQQSGILTSTVSQNSEMYKAMSSIYNSYPTTLPKAMYDDVEAESQDDDENDDDDDDDNDS